MNSRFGSLARRVMTKIAGQVAVGGLHEGVAEKRIARPRAERDSGDHLFRIPRNGDSSGRGGEDSADQARKVIQRHCLSQRPHDSEAALRVLLRHDDLLIDESQSGGEDA